MPQGTQALSFGLTTIRLPTRQIHFGRTASFVRRRRARLFEVIGLKVGSVDSARHLTTNFKGGGCLVEDAGMQGIES